MNRDPASGYFLHRPTEMYYDPKGKWYCKRDPSGQYLYYQHVAGNVPPFVAVAAQPAAQPAVQPAQAATVPAAGLPKRCNTISVRRT